MEAPGLFDALAAEPGLTRPPVLDACCGSRMMWFDREDERAVYLDARTESHVLPDASSAGGSRHLVIAPDVEGDFRDLPFAAGSFAHVVFDPPHLLSAGPSSWLRKKYGMLAHTWRDDLRRGFSECFRVLRPEGTLVFKWNETQVPVRDVLALTPHRPLYGHRSGKRMGTHWIAFLKPASGVTTPR